MKIAIVGATGHVGKCLVAEALQRGHEVTAIARDPAKLAAREHLRLVSADAHDASALAAALRGHDAVVSSIPFRAVSPAPLLHAVRAAGAKRYLVVGGAGSLEVAPGKLHVDAPQFPAPYKEEARLGTEFLKALRGAHDLDWTFLSPSAMFVAGERTGKFRRGSDQLITSADGRSWISYEDYALAMLDEIEEPTHVRSRFTVGY